MITKRFVISIKVSLAAAVLFVGCGRKSPQLNETREIPVGVILPLSGGAASLGKSCLNGIQLAADEFNEANHERLPRVRLIIEDDQIQPAIAVSAFQKLASANKVQAVIGPLSSGAALAVAPLAERNHIVVLSPGASTPALTAAGDYVFRNELSEEYGARIQAELAVNPLGFKRVALLYINNEYGAGTVKVFRERYLQLDGKIVDEEAFTQGASDFRIALTRIKSSSPDAIFVVFQDEIVNIARQKRELAVQGAIYTTAVVEDAAILDGLGTLAEGIIYTHYGSFDNAGRTGAVGDFVSKYNARFGTTPTYYSALGYDAGGILCRALADAGGDPNGIKDALYKIRAFPGITGPTSFDQNGDVTKPVILKTIRNGHSAPYNP